MCGSSWPLAGLVALCCPWHPNVAPCSLLRPLANPLQPFGASHHLSQPLTALPSPLQPFPVLHSLLQLLATPHSPSQPLMTPHNHSWPHGPPSVPYSPSNPAAPCSPLWPLMVPHSCCLQPLMAPCGPHSPLRSIMAPLWTQVAPRYPQSLVAFFFMESFFFTESG
jgi:hypothetical protein